MVQDPDHLAAPARRQRPPRWQKQWPGLWPKLLLTPATGALRPRLPRARRPSPGRFPQQQPQPLQMLAPPVCPACWAFALLLYCLFIILTAQIRKTKTLPVFVLTGFFCIAATCLMPRSVAQVIRHVDSPGTSPNAPQHVARFMLGLCQPDAVLHPARPCP
jgi:hypothetical protein